MSVKTIVNLLADTASVINDNTTRDISPADVRNSFTDLIESSVNRITDKPLLNLREYNTARAYEVGEGAIYLGTIYQCTTATTGTFTPGHWAAIVGPEVIALTALSDVTISAPVSGHVLTWNGALWVNQAPAGITSLNGLTATSQTFADVDDTNVTISIGSATSTHTFTMGWTGTLANGRGGTGFGTYSTGDILYASAPNVLSKLAATTNGFVLTLAAGVPVWAASSSGWAINGNTLGNDTSWAGSIDNFDYSIRTNSVERLRVLKTGEVGIGTATPTGKLDVIGIASDLHVLRVQGINNGTGKNLIYASSDTNTKALVIRDDGFAGFGVDAPTAAEQFNVSFGSGSTIGRTFFVNTSASGSYEQRVRNDGGFDISTLVFGSTYVNAAPWAGEPWAVANQVATVGFGSNGYNIVVQGSGAMKFYSGTAGSTVERMRILATGNIGIGETSPSARLHVVGSGATSATYALKVFNSTPTLNFSVRDDGRIAMAGLQTGNAGLATGDLYVDSAANILANGDQVVGRKV